MWGGKQLGVAKKKRRVHQNGTRSFGAPKYDIDKAGTVVIGIRVDISQCDELAEIGRPGDVTCWVIISPAEVDASAVALES